MPAAPSSPAKPLVILVVGVSGSGKSTLVRNLIGYRMARGLPCSEAVSTTTRAARTGEVNGEHYHFIDAKRFAQMLAQGELAEHVSFAGQSYGLERREIDERLARGEDVFAVVEPQGAAQIAALYPGRTVMVLVESPQEHELLERLTARDGSFAKAIARIENDQTAFAWNPQSLDLFTLRIAQGPPMKMMLRVNRALHYGPFRYDTSTAA